jgi:hypothetical protein
VNPLTDPARCEKHFQPFDFQQVTSIRNTASFMSIETFPVKSRKARSGDSTSLAGPLDLEQMVLGKSKSPAKVFGDAAALGHVYRWGMTVAVSAHSPAEDDGDEGSFAWESDQDMDLLKSLSRLACDLEGKSKKKSERASAIDWANAAEQAIDSFKSFRIPTADQASMAVVWAAALPKLGAVLEADVLNELTGALIELHEAILNRGDVASISHLIVGGELGLTLAWRLPGLPQRKTILQNAGDAVADWAERDDESVSVAIAGAIYARLALASLIRCRKLMKSIANRKFTKQNLLTADILATWVAVMTGHRGISAFSAASPEDVKADTGKHGLLEAAKQFDPQAIGPAMDAAMGASQTGGRLAWEVSLPDSMWCDESSKLAILLPEWDAARGRTHIDFSGQDVAVELLAGRVAMLRGSLQTSLEINGAPQQPAGDWDEICRYSDDDVHYLELEQPWSANYIIQRQFLMIREDRCVMIADAVMPKVAETAMDSQMENGGIDPVTIDYRVTFPLADRAAAIEEQETRELLLRSIDGKRSGNQAMVLPLSASEWKLGPTSSKLILADADRVVFQATGRGRLYAPLWIDFARRRLKRKRTWRKLTVCDALQLVPAQDAVAFRIQVGSEQWAIYRSMGSQRCRTFLGKHIMADFYVSRFDTGDGTHDALITVDDHQEDGS